MCLIYTYAWVLFILYDSKNTTEESSEAADNTQLNDKEHASDNPTNPTVDSKDGESQESRVRDRDITESIKDDYLKYLNNTKNITEKWKH